MFRCIPLLKEASASPGPCNTKQQLLHLECLWDALHVEFHPQTRSLLSNMMSEVIITNRMLKYTVCGSESAVQEYRRNLPDVGRGVLHDTAPQQLWMRHCFKREISSDI